MATLIVDVIGAENCVEIRLTEASGRFELAQYRNATLLKAFDVPCDFLKNKNADVLKKLTGGDEVGGEQVGRELDALEAGVDALGEGFDGQGFCEPRHPFEQDMPVGQ